MNNGPIEAEKFDYEKVSAAMKNVIDQRDAARDTMNKITEILSSAISNTESVDGAATERALGGNTKNIWELWNGFYEDFDKFSTSMNTMYENVVTAQETNKGFESSTATTIGSNIEPETDASDNQSA